MARKPSLLLALRDTILDVVCSRANKLGTASPSRALHAASDSPELVSERAVVVTLQ